jgi:hypothetical protein
MMIHSTNLPLQLTSSQLAQAPHIHSKPFSATLPKLWPAQVRRFLLMQFMNRTCLLKPWNDCTWFPQLEILEWLANVERLLGADNEQSKSKSNSSRQDDDDVDDSQDKNNYQGIVGPDILICLALENWKWYPLQKLLWVRN